MLALGIDTATAATTVAVVTWENVGPIALSERSVVGARAHGELLAPMIMDALREARARPSDLEAVVAGTGPGPYTGLRVGLATAAALGQALAVPTYGVCSLDAIGHAAAAVGIHSPRFGMGDWSGRAVVVATDARRGELYWATYGAGHRLLGPAVDRPDEVARVARYHRMRLAVGEGAYRYREAFPIRVMDELQYPSAISLVSLAADRVVASAPGEVLVPRYLRHPHATLPAGA